LGKTSAGDFRLKLIVDVLPFSFMLPVSKVRLLFCKRFINLSKVFHGFFVASVNIIRENVVASERHKI